MRTPGRGARRARRRKARVVARLRRSASGNPAGAPAAWDHVAGVAERRGSGAVEAGRRRAPADGEAGDRRARGGVSFV